jgi:hypothetical protein
MKWGASDGVVAAFDTSPCFVKILRTARIQAHGSCLTSMSLYHSSRRQWCSCQTNFGMLKKTVSKAAGESNPEAYPRRVR